MLTGKASATRYDYHMPLSVGLKHSSCRVKADTPQVAGDVCRHGESPKRFSCFSTLGI